MWYTSRMNENPYNANWKLTPEQKLAISEALTEKVSIYSLAKAYSVSEATIRYYKKKLDRQYVVTQAPMPERRTGRPPKFKPFKSKISGLDS